MLGASKYARNNQTWTYILGASKYAQNNQNWTYMLGASKYARATIIGHKHIDLIVPQSLFISKYVLIGRNYSEHQLKYAYSSNHYHTYNLGASKYARSNHSWTYMLGAFLNYARSNQSFTYMLRASKYARSNHH